VSHAAHSLGSLLGYLAQRRRRDAGDLAAHAELAWRGGDLPHGVELEWLGTSGFRLAYQGYTVLIDPYVSRLSLRRLLGRHAALPDPAEVRRRVPVADAVLVGHAHFDHVLDVPLIARQTGARVFGSRSTSNLMALYDLAGQMVEVEAYRVYELGPFEVSFVPSVHAKLLLGMAVPFDGDLSCDHLEGLTAARYGCGQVYGIHILVAGKSFYHLGSADLVDDAVVHRGVDYFLCGIAGRGFSDHYLERVLGRLEPRVVVPHHYDDFFRPLDAPLALSFNVDLAGCVDEIRRVSSDFEVRTLEPLAPIAG
jgi:L-ascorbate metabolism protein UlaG (beta-lactamase superfamily)